EAHQLEDVATQYFGIAVSSYRIDDLARDADRALAAKLVADAHCADRCMVASMSHAIELPELSEARAAATEALVVLTVGSDCNVGKMTAALEIDRVLRARGVRSAFVATGQTGIFVADHGVAVDAVPSDFVAGVTEELVLEAARDAEVVLVEGQGALRHPGYSGVTLALLHGAAPAGLILCHQSGRESLRPPKLRAGSVGPIEIPPLPELVREYQQVAAWVRPAVVLGVALNTRDLDERDAREAVAAAARATGLPATDPVRFGAAPLADAVAAAITSRRRHATAT
ncbi:MAG TPA: NAD-dependent epimerase/dehydratase family protein, partial [Candidatus Eisenbacteria bacterium]|nr:NAD-dependent epimerase/dehydratase family protein [Candidatus Eisenbacteria bacterium]